MNLINNSSVDIAKFLQNKTKLWGKINANRVFDPNVYIDSPKVCKLENITNEYLEDMLNKFISDENYINIMIVDGILITTEENDFFKISQNHSINLKVIQETIKPLKVVCINTIQTKNKIVDYNLNIELNENTSTKLDIDVLSETADKSIANINTHVYLKSYAKVSFTNISTSRCKNVLYVNNNFTADIDKCAELNMFNFVDKSLFLSNNFNINLNGKKSRFDAKGLYLLLKNKHIVEFAFNVVHKASDTYSNIDFKGVVDANSKAFFNSLTIVEHGLDKIQAFQNNKNIQLNNKSQITTKPELEIFSDDIVCNHGATVGQLDNEALFYLKSRGIPEDKAKLLLIESFVFELLESADLDKYTHRKLNQIILGLIKA